MLSLLLTLAVVCLFHCLCSLHLFKVTFGSQFFRTLRIKLLHFCVLVYPFKIFFSDLSQVGQSSRSNGNNLHQESWIFVEEDAESQTSISTNQDDDENMRKCVGDNWIEVTDSSPIITDVVQFILSV